MTFEDSGMPGFFLDHTSEEEVLYMKWYMFLKCSYLCAPANDYSAVEFLEPYGNSTRNRPGM